MNDLEEIKNKIDIVSFISEYIPLRRTGQNFKANCPFHQEKTASFVVSPARQIWHCFGSCSEGGDIFKFLMKWENISFGEALRELAKRAGVPLSSQSYLQSQDEAKKAKFYQINQLAAEFYHWVLVAQPIAQKARDYAKNRDLGPETQKLFKMGYAPMGGNPLVRFLQKKGYTSQELKEIGLAGINANGVYDWFRDRLMFPLKDHRGNICGFSGRLLNPEIKEQKYINTMETLIYHKGYLLYNLELAKEEIKKEGKAVITEGEIDCIQSFQHGVKNVVALKGTALTEGQINLLKRYTERVYLALDADLAGDAAARRGLELAYNAGLEIKIVQLLAGKDPDECCRTNPGLWKESVEKAVPLYDFVIDSAVKRFGSESAESKKKIGAEVVPWLKKIENSIVRDHYARKLAKILGVSEIAVEQAIKDTKDVERQRTEDGRQTAEENGRRKTDRRTILEEYILAIGLQNWGMKIEIKSRDLGSPVLKKIWEAKEKSTAKNAAEFIKILAPELQETADRLYLQDLGNLNEDSQRTEHETEKIIAELREMAKRETLKDKIGDKN